jgi:hypothetical protein
VASGDTLCVLTPAHVEAAKSDCGLGTRNSMVVLLFDDTTDENAYFRGLMPRHYAGGGVTVNVHCSSKDVTVTPHNFVVQAAFMSITHDADDLDSDSFAALNGSGAVAEASASGETVEAAITFTDGADMDSVAAGEQFWLQLRRDADDTSATDALTDDLEVWLIEIKET